MAPQAPESAVGFAASAEVGGGRRPRLSLLIPPAALAAVLAFAIGGRVMGESADAAPALTPAATASVAPAPTSADPSPPDVAAAEVPGTAWRSDWPAAIRGTPPPYRRGREEGTDGLMGGLPFGLPNDTPLVPAERHDRFVTDDIRPPNP